MLIDGSGNVGIGTASPSTLLHLSGSAPILRFTDTSGDAYAQIDCDSPDEGTIRIQADPGNAGANTIIRFDTDGSERMRIDSSGNVGIGTSSPAGRLHARFDAGVSDSYTGKYIFQTTDQRLTIGTYWQSGVGQYATIQSESASSVAQNLLLNPSGGNVGIGQSSPSYKLQVNNASASATADAITVQNSGVTTTGHTAGIRFKYIGAEPAAIRAILTNLVNGAGSLAFYTSSDGSGANLTERMRIASDGTIGVGGTNVSSVRLLSYAASTGSDSWALYAKNSTPTDLFGVRGDGAIYTGVGTLSPYNLTTGAAANLFVDGDRYIYRSTSSLRYKSDVADATHGLADLLKLRSVTYKSKNNGDTVFGGLIAEEVHDAGLTEFVSYDKENQPDAIHYGNMVALLTKAIQEQQAMIDELKAKVAALETK
jgi:hypothetical protein